MRDRIDDLPLAGIRPLETSVDLSFGLALAISVLSLRRWLLILREILGDTAS